MKPSQKQLGVSLIEILVAILILSFGLLGVAGLMTTGMKNTQSSQYRTQASFLAYDIAERMRTNRQAALNGDYAATSPGGIAGTDKTEWQAAVATLPAGTGTVAMTSTTFFTITIQWDDSKATGGGTADQFLFRGEL
jgi:type IV pilus assembly protein PilV